MDNYQLRIKKQKCAFQILIIIQISSNNYMENLKQKLSSTEINIKDIVDWNNGNAIQETMLSLQEWSAQLQNDLSQSIEQHLIGRDKAINVISSSVQLIKQNDQRFNQICNNHKNHQKEDNLEHLMEMIDIKNKIDFCLLKLDPIVNFADQLQQEKIK